MMMLAQRGSSANKNSEQMPAIMRNSQVYTRSHTTGPTSVNSGDRMTTSFTVAFGSSSPRSICTKANEAILRSQAAFEARLASYLNGRHSGCFLTQSSAYTNYALYVKPDLLPENHPIRRHLHEGHHHVSTPRRAASANPTVHTAAIKKPTLISGAVICFSSLFEIRYLFLHCRKVGERGLRDGSDTRQAPQAKHRSRPTVRLPPPGNIDNTEAAAAATANLPQPTRRAASSQHFAEPTIAFASKVKGALPPEISRKISGDVTPPKRRPVPGRSTIPRGRCNSYAAPTTAWTNRQRANSQDRKTSAPSAAGSDNRMTTSVILPRRKPTMPASTMKPTRGEGDEARGRAKLKEQMKQSTTPVQPPQHKTQPPRTAPLKAIPAKKTAANKSSNEPIKPNTSECLAPTNVKSKPIAPRKANDFESVPETPKSVAKPNPAHPTSTIKRPPTALTPEPQEIYGESSTEPISSSQPPSLVTELQEFYTPAPPNESAAKEHLARPITPSPPPPDSPPPDQFNEDTGEIIQQRQTEEEEEPVQEPPAAFADHEEAPEAIAEENSEGILTEGEQHLANAPNHGQFEETPISESKPEEVEVQHGRHQAIQEGDERQMGTHNFDNLDSAQTGINHEPPPHSSYFSTKSHEVEEKTARLPAELLSKPLVASTTGSGEGGSLTEEEAAIYRAKMAEQRRLAKERLAEQQRLEAEAEKERKAKREADRQAAIEAAREKAIEEARLAAEVRMAREAAEEQARLEAERKAQERADRDRQAVSWSKAVADLSESEVEKLEAMMRERSERIRKSEEEREMRRKRLESIMSRVNRSDRSLSRGVTNSGSTNSLTSSVTGAASTNGLDDDGPRSGATVNFSLGSHNVS
ncbi:unnamed protein product [Rodentolepis nana]|uniref:CCDC66 domain-containing protein n=1 Tax=Rodentolepis nana TaxID=102285 RepID=A0A158QJA0_RODNA|nr:unnamed protein product [Rodentolepis nana]